MEIMKNSGKSACARCRTSPLAPNPAALRYLPQTAAERPGLGRVERDGAAEQARGAIEGQRGRRVLRSALDVDRCAIGEARREQMIGEELVVDLEFLERAGQLRMALPQRFFVEHRQRRLGDAIVVWLDRFSARCLSPSNQILRRERRERLLQLPAAERTMKRGAKNRTSG